jgi:ribosomal protein S18 acetylase RimI-like enzyme
VDNQTDTSKSKLTIRPYSSHDWSEVWGILEPTFRSGDTYAYSPEINEAEAYRVWIDTPLAIFVACDEEEKLLGTYFLKPNQPGLGSHVCNCGYVVDAHASSRGVASAMCEHSQREALRLGFINMQFNLVAASNERAVRLWKRHGFDVVGVLPKAFH